MRSLRLIASLPPGICVVASLLLAVPMAQAQSARRVPGLWVGLAAGAGSGGLSCDACVDTESRLGPSAVLTLGRTVSSSLGFGLELSGWRKGIDGAVDHQGFLMGTAFIFPGLGGAYLAGGVGLARFTSSVGRGRDRTSTLGGGWRIGAGYDMRFGREISLAPFISYYGSTSSGLKINGSSTGTDISHHLLQVGVGLQWNFTGAIGFPAPTER